MLIFVLPTKKHVIVSFWTFSQQPQRIKKKQNHQIFLLMQEYLSEVNWITPCSALTLYLYKLVMIRNWA